MTTATTQRSKTGLGFRVGLVVTTVLALAAGLYGTAFSMVAVWAVGGLAAVIGAIGAARHTRWGFLLLVIGGPLLVGSVAYITLGLIQPDGPASGGGSGFAPSP